jgi:hypothetical protein
MEVARVVVPEARRLGCVKSGRMVVEPMGTPEDGGPDVAKAVVGVDVPAAQDGSAGSRETKPPISATQPFEWNWSITGRTLPEKVHGAVVLPFTKLPSQVGQPKLAPLPLPD